ncbi:MAG: energy transducer TonB [Arcobacter sp.]|nr:energy transducer TonB [Arcobacter sp.]
MKSHSILFLISFVMLNSCSSIIQVQSNSEPNNDKNIINYHNDLHLPIDYNCIKNIELLALLTPIFVKDLIPPELTISNDSLLSKIKYPEIAEYAGVRGIVIVEFLVDSFGDTKNIEVVSSIGAGCDEEVLSVFKNIKFKPAYKNKEPQKSKMRASIKFSLRHPL